MEKIEALAKFLGIDDLDQIEEKSYCFTVNPHTKKIGDSPKEKLAKVNLVKKALDLSGITKVLDIEASDFTKELYTPITKMFYKYCNELTKIGIHDLVNTVYFLCGGSNSTDSRETELKTDYLDLFEGNDIEDNREEIEVSDGDYLVYTDSEADDAYSESMQSYVDDCVLNEIPEQYRAYFDTETFIKDCAIDGRGSTLATYDSEENEDYGYYFYRIG